MKNHLPVAVAVFTVAAASAAPAVAAETLDLDMHAPTPTSAVAVSDHQSAQEPLCPLLRPGGGDVQPVDGGRVVQAGAHMRHAGASTDTAYPGSSNGRVEVDALPRSSPSSHGERSPVNRAQGPRSANEHDLPHRSGRGLGSARARRWRANDARSVAPVRLRPQGSRVAGRLHVQRE